MISSGVMPLLAVAPRAFKLREKRARTPAVPAACRRDPHSAMCTRPMGVCTIVALALRIMSARFATCFSYLHNRSLTVRETAKETDTDHMTKP